MQVEFILGFKLSTADGHFKGAICRCSDMKHRSFQKQKVSPSDHVCDSLGENSSFDRLVVGLHNLPAQEATEDRKGESLSPNSVCVCVCVCVCVYSGDTFQLKSIQVSFIFYGTTSQPR